MTCAGHMTPATSSRAPSTILPSSGMCKRVGGKGEGCGWEGGKRVYGCVEIGDGIG